MTSARWPDLAGLADRVLAAPPRLGVVRLVAVDGPAGSGKTTFAADLAGAIARRGAVVEAVHLDDLYEGWSGLPGVWDRLNAWVLRPLADGGAARYRRYDWTAGKWDGWVDLPAPDVLVVEGCGSAPRAVDGSAVLRVWVDAAADVRLARGVARDGEDHRDLWLAWMESEAAHFATEATRERADVRLAT